GLQLPPGVAARGGPARRAPRPGGLRGPGTGRAVLSGAARGRAGGRAAAPQGPLPDVQRLHERAAPGTPLRLLPARSVLRRPPGRGAAAGGQGGLRLTAPAATERLSRDQAVAVGSAFLALFAIVGC